MADGQPQAGDLGEAARSPRRPTAAPNPAPASPPLTPLTPRIALAAALLAVALAGIRAALPATGWDDGRWHGQGIPLGIGLELVFVALLTAVEFRRRRRPTASQPTAGLRGLLRALLLIGVFAIPVLLLLNGVGKVTPRHPPPLRPPPQRLPTRSARPHALAGHNGGHGGALVLYALLVLALLAAIAACVILLRRRTQATAWDDSREIIDDQPDEQLRRAVQSGQAALREIDDARMAIIACYVAMEDSLARAGTVRADAETPDELLGRAAEAGLVHGQEAARLTASFYEARFSSHPLPPARREEARRALAVLAGRLAEQASTAVAGESP